MGSLRNEFVFYVFPILAVANLCRSSYIFFCLVSSVLRLLFLLSLMCRPRQQIYQSSTDCQHSLGVLIIEHMRTQFSGYATVLLIVIALMGAVQGQVSFTVNSVTASPSTARATNAQYVIQLSAIGSFSTNFDIQLSYTSAFALSSLSGCTVAVNGATVASAVCTRNSNSISFSSLNIATTVNSVTLTFNTSTAIYAGSFTLTLAYHQPSNSATVYSTSSTLLIISNAPMTCSLASTSNTVGASANYTLTYSPSVYISVNSYLQVIFPAWSTYFLTNFPSGTSASICGGLCTVRNPNTGQSFFNEILSYTNLYPSDTNSTTPIQFTGARNPASTLPISVTVNLLHYISSTSQPSYMTCSVSYQATTPGTFSSISFNPSNTAISGQSTISLFLSLPNPISSISYLSISYGSDMSLSYAYVTSNQQTTQVSVASGTANTLLLTNLTNSTSQVSSLFMASFTLTNPPYASLSNSITFLTRNLVSGSFYSIDSGSVTVSATVSTIVMSAANMLDTSIGVVSSLTVSFTTVNALITGSKIIITVPGEISLIIGTSSCSCSISSTCSVTNTSSILVNINAISVAAATNVPITITSVNNPPTTTTTSSFTIGTYYTNDSTPVDRLTSGLTLTATPVTLSSGAVSSSSPVVAASSTYTITIQNRNPLPSGSYLTVIFPGDFPTALGISLTSFTSASNVISACTLSAVTSLSYNLTNCIPSALSAGTSMIIVLANVVNPGSTKPTSSLQVQTYYNSKLMEYMTTGLTVTMTTPTTLTFSSLTPFNATANAQTSYVLAVTFSQTHYSGDKIVLTVPTTITLNSGFTCTTTTSGLSVACFKQSTQDLAITVTSTGIYTSITVTITNFQNNWYSSSSSFPIKTTTNDTSSTYYVEQGTASVTMTAAVLSTSYTPTNLLTLLSSSTLSLRITSPFTISAPDPTLLKIDITVPSEFTPSATCTGSLTGSSCTLVGSVYTLTGLSLFTNTVNVTFTATANYFTTSSAIFSVLSYNGSQVATDSSLTVSPFCTSPCQGCTTTASQCTSCLPSPYTSNNYLYSPNNTCLSACPSGHYLPNATFTCQQCDTTVCLSCSSTATSCTACSSPRYLFNSSCVLVCPNTYYGDNTTCLPCTNQCYNCTSATNCLSCSPSYNLNPNNTCLNTCPSTYIALAQVCTKCTSPCATCSGSVVNCSTCVTNYLLFNNTCIQACPDGRYQDANQQCQLCVSPCQFCTTAIACTSCVTNYFLYNSTQCVMICPAGSYGTANVCQNCSSPCQTCSSTSTNCTSCFSGEYLYSNKCYATCPTNTYPYLGNCTTCVSPCATCLNGAFSCSTCESGYMLLNTSCVLTCPSSGYVQLNGSCVACPNYCVSCSSSTACSACQSGYFLYQGSCVVSCPSTSPIVVNQQCTPCNVQCATCQDSPSNCLTCTVFYFKYSYTCVTSCPLSFYSNEITYTCQSGLSSKIVFFPVLITYLVLIGLLIVIKICARTTSLPTTITAFSGLLELVIWCYMLSLIFSSYLEPGINYDLPRALIFIALFLSLGCNIVHFKVNLPRLSQDEYIRKWQDVNVNHTYLVAIRYISLFSHHKFFRIIYSKIFDSLHFSMVAFKRSNLFTVSTVFTITSLLLCQLPVITAAFFLAYNKILKDQVFYTSVQVLIVTVISIIISLIDIYKPEDYFEDTEFMITKRYLEKVNNESSNKLEDEYRMKDEGSVDGEKVLGTSGGKFIFSKRGADGSQGQLFFQEQSAVTDAHEHSKKLKAIQVQDIQMEDNEYAHEDYGSSSLRSPRTPKSANLREVNARTAKSSALINIFDPIQEEEAQYYEALKYDEDDFKTAAKIQKEKYDGNASEEENDLEEERKVQFGMSEREQSNIDDNMSLLEYRERREEWNKIIDHRQKLAQHIFNTVDTKQLYKIEEPLDEDQEDRERRPVKQRVFNKTPDKLRKMRDARRRLEEELQGARMNNHQFRVTEVEDLMEQEEPEGGRKRRRRRGKPRKGNRELEEIYLQRLAEKMPDQKKKTMYASSKSYNYEF